MAQDREGVGRPVARTWWRAELLAGAEIVGLCAFAVTQPVLDVFGRAPDVLVFRDASRSDILLFAAILTIGPPLAVAVPATLTRLLGARFRSAVQLVVVAGLGSVIGLQVAGRLTRLPAGLVVALGVAAGLVLALAHARTRVARQFLRVTAAAPALFLAAFLFVSPTSKLLFTHEVAAASVRPTAELAPVVFVVLDEFPMESIVDADGHVDAALFPNFARLAGDSTWYRDFTTVSNATWHAVPALLTGMLPRDGTAPVASDHPRSLFTLLGGTYQIRAFEAVTRLCPSGLCEQGAGEGGGGLRRLLADARGVWVDVTKPRRTAAASSQLVEQAASGIVGDANRKAADARLDLGADFAANVPARFQEFVAGLGDDPARPHPFDYLHLLLPHEAWQYYPSGMRYQLPSPLQFPGRDGDVWGPSPRAVEVGRQRHLLQAQYTDRLLGRLLDRLQAQGVYDRTLLVVTSDHGIAFQPGLPARALGGGPVIPEEVRPDLLWSLCFIKAPGQHRGVVDDRNVQSVDVMPTVADLLGVRVPWRVDGVSATSDAPRPGKRVLKSTSGTFGPSVEPATPVDAARDRPEVFARSVGNFRGPGDPALALYRLGPYGDLVGRRVHDLARGSPAPGASATVEERARFDAVDRASGVVPGLVVGAAEGVSRRAQVLVAVDGRVAGVSSTFADRGRAHTFEVLAPDSLFRDGRNDLALYLVDGPPSAPVLHQLALR